MATRPKAIIESRNGEKFSPITIAKNVLTDDGQNLHDILSDRKEDMMTPTIENSSSMFKVGQGDSVDYSDNIVNGAYESMVLKGKSMVNCIQEPSSQDVVLPYEFEDGQYVTINDTKESGALGVELKGQTLVNVLGDNVISKSSNSTFVKNGDTIIFENTVETAWSQVNIGFTHQLKPLTKYLVKWDSIVWSNENFNPSGSFISLREMNTNTGCSSWTNGKNYMIGTTPEDVSKMSLRIHATVSDSLVNTVTVKGLKVLEYQEGMENWDIPYFEGMTSCKMPILHTVGKNLFDINGYSTKNQYASINGNTITVNAPTTFSNTVYTLTGLKEGELYRVSLDKTGAGEFSIRDTNASSLLYVEKEEGHVSRTFTYKKGATIRIGNRQIVNSEVSFTNIQIEHGSTETAHENYKSSVLSLPEEVVLRNIGSVKDTLNLNTGDYIQRIGEVVLDGSEDEKWTLHQISSYTTHTRFEFGLRSNNKPLGIVHTELKCDRFTWINGDVETEHIKIDGGNARSIFLYIQNSKLATQDVNGLRVWLSQNPTTIQYELETPIVTKINLPSTLKSWNTITHIYSKIPENSLYPILSHSNPTYSVILKPSTKYSIVANSYSNNHTNSAINFNLGGATVSTTAGNRVTTITTPSTLSNELLTMSGRGNKLNNVMVIEGDVVGDEPYFEGICDCKSPILSNVGKNLFTTNNMRTGNIAGNGSHIEGNDIGGDWQVTDYIPVKPLIKYYHSTSLYKFEKVSFYDINKKIIYGTGVNHFKTMVISTPHQCAYVRYVVMKDSSTNNSLSLEELVSNNDIVVTQGDSNIVYEPYKSNTITFNQKDDKTIVLRSLDKTHTDTLNVETGEYVSYVKQVVLTGSESENWNLYHDESSAVNPRSFYITLAQGEVAGSNQRLFLNDKYPIMKSTTQECAWYFDTNGHKIAFTDINKRFANVSEWRNYLKTNPITLFYTRLTPIVSTVDIQGFPYAYTNGHVQLSSGSIEQSLTPKVEYSLATNRSGQIRSNQMMVERHQKQLDRLQAMILTNLVNTQYEQTLTNLKYDLKNVREEVK